MKRILPGMIALAFLAGTCLAATPESTQMVITVRPAPERLAANDLTVARGTYLEPIVRLERLAGNLADMQLFVFLDDSTRSAALGTQLPTLRAFIESLPGTTQVAVGYMRNGSFALAQGFTADHAKAARSLRLPDAQPGENGSPYFALSDLVNHWPSKQTTGRRAVLMLTDGVDRYYTAASMDDPYVNAAIHDSLKHGVMVYSIYLRGAGFYDRGAWVTNIAQSRLIKVSEETGGYAYSLGFTDPVTITPFLNDFNNRLDNQYQLTIEAFNEKGVQPVKVQTELPGVRIEAPSRIYVR